MPMKSIACAISTAAMALVPAMCLAQIARVEVYPIQSVTMSDQDCSVPVLMPASSVA